MSSLQKIGPKQLAAALPLNAAWSSQALKPSSLSHITLMFEATTTASTSQFVIEVRIGNGNDVPYSSWQTLTLASALQLAGANYTQVVLLTDLAVSELRVRMIQDAGSNGTFSVWAEGRGFH